MTYEKHLELWLQDTVEEFSDPEAAAYFMEKVKRKIVSVAEAKRIEKRKQKKAKKAARLAKQLPAVGLILALLFVGCTSTEIRGEAEATELEILGVAPVAAGTLTAPCETPCGDDCCVERAFCYEGACQCFAGLDECGDICCPEMEPVCVEGECT